MDFFSFVSFYLGMAALLFVVLTIAGVQLSSYHNKIDKLNSTAIKLFQQGRPDEAVEYLEKALKRNPACPSSHAILAQVLSEQQQNIDRAVEEINTAIKLAPLTGEFYCIRGSILIDKLQQIDAGHQDFRRAEELGYSPKSTVPTLITT